MCSTQILQHTLYRTYPRNLSGISYKCIVDEGEPGRYGIANVSADTCITCAADNKDLDDKKVHLTWQLRPEGEEKNTVRKRQAEEA